jgi:hypothetical protein
MVWRVCLTSEQIQWVYTLQEGGGEGEGEGRRRRSVLASEVMNGVETIKLFSDMSVSKLHMLNEGLD